MNTRHRRPRCRTFSATSPRIAAPQQPAAMLAAVRGQSAINLAELARAIAADRNLCRRVTEAAFQEFGWPGLSVEQAIVLLGRERLASQFLRLPQISQRMAPAGNLCPQEPLQGEAE